MDMILILNLNFDDMIKKLLFQEQDKKQLILASIGIFLGVLFLMLSLHYWVKINEIGKGSEVLGTNTLIVQKKVTNVNTLNLSRTDFSENEIEKIRIEKSIKQIAAIHSNNFNVSLQTSDPLVPYFRSDIFIQSLDKQFIDVQLNEWKWVEGQSYVPMIMPREFLLMLNTFMSASGIPQVSDDLAKKIKFQFKIWNGGIEEKVNVRIVGFTNEVSSILVPISFMEYASKKYGTKEKQKITQVVIQGKEGNFGLVEQLLHERGLEPKNAQLVVGRLKSVVETLFLIILIIACVALFVSSLVLIQYLELIITKNSYNIQTLIRIGFDYKLLISWFVKYLVFFFGIISVIGVLLFVFMKQVIDNLFSKGGLYLEDSYTILNFSLLGIVFLFFAFISYKSTKKEILKHYQ